MKSRSELLTPGDYIGECFEFDARYSKGLATAGMTIGVLKLKINDQTLISSYFPCNEIGLWRAGKFKLPVPKTDFDWGKVITPSPVGRKFLVRVTQNESNGTMYNNATLKENVPSTAGMTAWQELSAWIMEHGGGVYEFALLAAIRRGEENKQMRWPKEGDRL